MQRFEALQAINEAIDKDTTLSRRDRRRLKISVRLRPRVRQEAVGLVTAELHAEGMVTEDGHIEGAIDWEQLIGLIMKLLPILLTLL